MSKTSKRILSVTIKRMFDDSPDTSWLGEYGNTAKTEYAIDRAHSEDCASQSTETAQVGDLIEGIDECNCGFSGEWHRREYRYFNGCVENCEGETPEDIRKYVRQDYERMESLRAGNWYFIGIQAEAEIGIEGPEPARRGRTIHTITSGGLWGIESDSDKEYFAEVEQEELGQLRSQLKALGFSTRAISKAFKTIEREEE